MMVKVARAFAPAREVAQALPQKKRARHVLLGTMDLSAKNALLTVAAVSAEEKVHAMAMVPCLQTRRENVSVKAMHMVSFVRSAMHYPSALTVQCATEYATGRRATATAHATERGRLKAMALVRAIQGGAEEGALVRRPTNARVRLAVAMAFAWRAPSTASVRTDIPGWIAPRW